MDKRSSLFCATISRKESELYNIDTRTVGQFQFLEMAELDQVGKTARGQEGTA
jgi:hypothetical protein